MTDHSDDMNRLEACFEAARKATPEPSADLFARVLADAEGAQVHVDARISQSRPSWIAQVFKGLGGWPAMAGLATATVAGIWLGVSPPAPLEMAAETYLGLDQTAYLIDPTAEVVLGLDWEAM